MMLMAYGGAVLVGAFSPSVLCKLVTVRILVSNFYNKFNLVFIYALDLECDLRNSSLKFFFYDLFL